MPPVLAVKEDIIFLRDQNDQKERKKENEKRSERKDWSVTVYQVVFSSIS